MHLEAPSCYPFMQSFFHSYRTQFVQQGVIDAKGLGTLSSLVERLAKSFLVNGGSKVNASISVLLVYILVVEPLWFIKVLLLHWVFRHVNVLLCKN